MNSFELIEVVLCEMCGRKTALYPSERRLLAEHPRLTVTCEQCLESCKHDVNFATTKRLQHGSLVTG
jgi:hypothetical protein